MLGIEHPILCRGMQWISRAEIVAAVANPGGIGVITAESLETPEDLREVIKKIRDLILNSIYKMVDSSFTAHLFYVSL